MNNLDEKLLNYLDEHDVKIVGEFDDGAGFSEYEKSIDLEFYSDAGEDFVFTVSYTDDKSFVEDFAAYTENFDVEDHAELWIDHRGKNGCPETLKELLEDARGIREYLEDLSNGLQDILKEIEKEQDIDLWVNLVQKSQTFLQKKDVILKEYEVLNEQYAKLEFYGQEGEITICTSCKRLLWKIWRWRAYRRVSW